MGPAVATGCAPVDDLLAGGFERGSVTQVYGVPASGKTNLMLVAAASVLDAGGRVVYIDTEGLSLDRFDRILGATDAAMSIDSVEDQLLIQPVYDFDEQEIAVRETARHAADTDLIVIDSATGFYRLERTRQTGSADDGESLRRVTRQVTHLLGLARKHDLAVVLTNQVFTDPDADRIRALGGHTLAHWTATILRIDRFRGGNRRLTIEKHRDRAAGQSARFRITDTGITAVEL
ncbi:MAG: DNA repair and recombination protein RadB [Haloquadratum sp.]|nr:DNA repair and recombination protein RadB [Haloferacaceae archaeon]MDR9445188.1 DNA repair and recombination protein RadB [Haloquadratum sp.]